jgi:hypothetical protein
MQSKLASTKAFDPEIMPQRRYVKAKRFHSNGLWTLIRPAVRYSGFIYFALLSLPIFYFLLSWYDDNDVTSYIDR